MNRSAGPPIRNVVYGASGSWRRMWAASNRAANRSSDFGSEFDIVKGKETMDEAAAPMRGRSRSRTFRASALIWVLAAAAALGAPRSGVAQRAELEQHVQRRTLPNGLDIIVVQNRGVPLVTIEADVKNGSFTQGPQYEGLSHLYEHMFFKANAAYPD